MNNNNNNNNDTLSLSSLSSISINDINDAINDVITYDGNTIITKFNANVLFIIDNQNIKCYVRNKVLSSLVSNNNDVDESQRVTSITTTNSEQKEQIIPDIIIETTLRTLQDIFTKKIINPHTAIIKGKIKIRGDNLSLLLKLQIIIDSTRKHLLLHQQQRKQQKKKQQQQQTQEHMLPKSRL